MKSISNNENGIVVSYLALRKAIGVLGILFPVILLLGSAISGYCAPFQSSISCCYHTDMRDVFEGILWVFAVFLIFYRYEKKDNIATTCAGFCALGIALFPCYCGGCDVCDGSPFDNKLAGYLHNGSAIVFFMTLSYISLFLFTKTSPERKPTPQKLKRNKVYKVCGVVMLVCIAFIAAYMLFLEDMCPSLKTLRPVFVLETLALWAFGISWIVKGEMILKD